MPYRRQVLLAMRQKSSLSGGAVAVVGRARQAGCRDDHGGLRNGGDVKDRGMKPPRAIQKLVGGGMGRLTTCVDA